MKAAPMTLRKLRRLYKVMWQREWPHDDEFLSELWNEVATPKLRGTAAARYFPEALIVMRENHEFTPGENA